jgi:transcriptional regulator with XRE-family HTH domain
LSAVQELWAELSASMRALRRNAGMSLRQAELASGRGRGTLSQIENGKARPSRDLTEWYDATFGGDGLLLSLYAEARGAHGPTSQRHFYPNVRDGDAMAVESALLPEGELVPCGSDVVAGWTLANTGTVAWSGRCVERVGAHAAARLIASAPEVPVPDCRPGERVRVELVLTVPEVAGTFAAHWVMVGDDRRPCFDGPRGRLRVLLTTVDGPPWSAE